MQAALMVYRYLKSMVLATANHYTITIVMKVFIAGCGGAPVGEPAAG
jgi:hypothetical protein